MLKRTESAEPPPAERPVGELVHELVEQCKAYALAELGLVKAMVDAKARALMIPAALLGVAFIVALAAVTALSVGTVLALAKYIGPLGAGVAGLLLFAAIAAGLGWYAVRLLRRAL